MNLNTVVIVDDLAADRQLASHALRHTGWNVYLARHSGEASKILATIVTPEIAAHTVILTDLHMPNDPIIHAASGTQRAGSSYALALRASMERGEQARMPIVALTALTEHEVHLTAIAFGCDAVLLKPATPNLARRIEMALAEAADEAKDTIGANAVLSLLRQRLAAEVLSESAKASLSEHDITKALLAYHRYGLVGLGQSLLARYLIPGDVSHFRRGEDALALLLQYVDEVCEYDAGKTLRLLGDELRNQVPPAEQCKQLGLSLSEYYRRRREAVEVLYALVVEKTSG